MKFHSAVVVPSSTRVHLPSGDPVIIPKHDVKSKLLLYGCPSSATDISNRSLDDVKSDPDEDMQYNGDQ